MNLCSFLSVTMSLLAISVSLMNTLLALPLTLRSGHIIVGSCTIFLTSFSDDNLRILNKGRLMTTNASHTFQILICKTIEKQCITFPPLQNDLLFCVDLSNIETCGFNVRKWVKVWEMEKPSQRNALAVANNGNFLVSRTPCSENQLGS